MELELKQGQVVTCTLVTGEMAVGFYETTNPRTGSYLIRKVTTINGERADYAWASKIDARFNNGLAEACYNS